MFLKHLSLYAHTMTSTVIVYLFKRRLRAHGTQCLERAFLRHHLTAVPTRAIQHTDETKYKISTIRRYFRKNKIHNSATFHTKFRQSSDMFLRIKRTIGTKVL